MDNNNINKEKSERSRDDKMTAGNLPDKQEQFEETTWVKDANHGSSSTEAERKNVAKTLPKTSAREKK